MSVTVLPKVTRLEVIDDRGRVLVTYYELNPGVQIHVQDNERTVKIFAGQHSEHLNYDSWGDGKEMNVEGTDDDLGS